MQTAKEFAIKAHGDQKYGAHPYSVHLDAVVAHLTFYGEEAKAIGYLHDVIEDTDVTEADITNHFGCYIAECVAILTDEPGDTRRDRKRATYQKMARVSKKHELALVVKAADRLANMQACVADKNKRLLQMYIVEHAFFKESVYRTGLCEEIWAALGQLVLIQAESL